MLLPQPRGPVHTPLSDARPASPKGKAGTHLLERSTWEGLHVRCCCPLTSEPVCGHHVHTPGLGYATQHRHHPQVAPQQSMDIENPPSWHCQRLESPTASSLLPGHSGPVSCTPHSYLDVLVTALEAALRSWKFTCPTTLSLLPPIAVSG